MARQESELRGLVRRLLAPLVGWLLRALAASWRVESIGDDPFRKPARPPILAAIWHEDVIVAAAHFRDTGAVVPVSRSRDGTDITAVMRHLGLADPPRGSSSRGGVTALRGLVRPLREGGIAAVMIDGPRGPARVAKPGIVAAARLSGEPILPVALVARPRIRFRSWDRTQLPLPFARLVVGWGDWIPVPRDATDEQREALRSELGKQLTSLRDAARAQLLRRGRRRTGERSDRDARDDAGDRGRGRDSSGRNGDDDRQSDRVASIGSRGGPSCS